MSKIVDVTIDMSQTFTFSTEIDDNMEMNDLETNLYLMSLKWKNFEKRAEHDLVIHVDPHIEFNEDDEIINIHEFFE